MKKFSKRSFEVKEILKFIIPSLIGILLLMTPFKINGATTVGVSLLSSIISQIINSIVPIPYLILICIFFSCLFSITYKLFKPKLIANNIILKEISDIGNFWIFLRIIGLIFVVLTLFQIGPKIIISESTGGLVLFELIVGLFTIFLIAGFILPFLTNFGLLEFVGVYLTNIMRPLFNLPGRSAVDCIASWIGDGTIGVALTSKQYEDGNYSEKEAAVIATSFSAVSITFCLVVIKNVGLTDYFGQFYLTICIVGIICALILPKIPPLSLKKNVYLKKGEDINSEVIPSDYSKKDWALTLAIKKANNNFSIKKFIFNGFSTVLNMWLGVIPIIMAVGTIALILSEHTSIFTYLGMPFLPILKFFNVSDALAASETMVVGFADMVVPSILAASMESVKTRFIVAVLSVCQLIYMSETGSVILGSKIPVNLFELFVIFIERTIIALPIIILLSNVFF